jgi:hypothetical protein
MWWGGAILSTSNPFTCYKQCVLNLRNTKGDLIMPTINGVSGNNPVQNTSSTSSTARTEKLVKSLGFEGQNTQEVTPQNVDNAFLLRPSQAVNYLLKKSPVGEDYPSTGELASKGYRMPYHKEADGSYIMPAASGSGKIILKPDAEDGTKTIVYQNEGFEQVMMWDKDGNVTSADFKFKDANTGMSSDIAHMKVVNGKKIYTN